MLAYTGASLDIYSTKSKKGRDKRERARVRSPRHRRTAMILNKGYRVSLSVSGGS